MLENKDQAIKLFGRTIQLACSTSYGDPMIAERIQASAAADCTTSDGNLFCCKQAKTCQKEISSRGEPAGDDNNQDEESSSISILDESKTTTTTTQSTTSNHDNNPKTLEDDHKDPIEKEDESEEASTNQEAPKKPEEILACPRCNSMDTKFCYFNNYNVKQPRHFCKNCQRYWTAGGSMRTVPVGSGRRKTKTKSNPDSSSPSNGFVWPEMMTAGSTQGLMMPPQPMACFAWNPIPNWQSFYSAPPPPQWICTPWNLHLLPHPSPPSPLLGKHCRDSHEEPLKEKRSTVAVPKTMRIADDPLEVARSSVCGGLAKNKDKPRCLNIGGGIFGGFHEYNKGVTVVDPERDHVCPQGSHVGINQANPAAFSRSLLFHEIGG